METPQIEPKEVSRILNSLPKDCSDTFEHGEFSYAMDELGEISAEDKLGNLFLLSGELFSEIDEDTHWIGLFEIL